MSQRRQRDRAGQDWPIVNKWSQLRLDAVKTNFHWAGSSRDSNTLQRKLSEKRIAGSPKALIAIHLHQRMLVPVP